MRTAIAFVVAMLVLSYVDQQFFLGTYSHAVVSIASQVMHFFYR